MLSAEKGLVSNVLSSSRNKLLPPVGVVQELSNTSDGVHVVFSSKSFRKRFRRQVCRERCESLDIDTNSSWTALKGNTEENETVLSMPCRVREGKVAQHDRLDGSCTWFWHASLSHVVSPSKKCSAMTHAFHESCWPHDHLLESHDWEQILVNTVSSNNRIYDSGPVGIVTEHSGKFSLQSNCNRLTTATAQKQIGRDCSLVSLDYNQLLLLLPVHV